MTNSNVAFPTSIDEVQGWIDQRAVQYGGKNAFFASVEYRQAYPCINALYDVEQKEYAARQKHAMQSAGVRLGDQVFYDYVTPWGVTAYSGVLVTKRGQARVRLDEGQTTMQGNRSVPWHRGWEKQ